jgi:hypothetical protein
MVRPPMLFARGALILLIDAAWVLRVIPSQFQRTHRFGGSERISTAGSLWMNLWKLCIALGLLHRLLRVTRVHCQGRRASMVRVKGSFSV